MTTQALHNTLGLETSLSLKTKSMRPPETTHFHCIWMNSLISIVEQFLLSCIPHTLAGSEIMLKLKKLLEVLQTIFL